ncbi:hypothetical protein O9X98_07685 [Agrobacterium salinitolerans]|nr:hypothetical protein [Agrobacterium salinitolerans]
MTMFGWFRRKEEPQDKNGLWLSNEDCARHFRELGAGRPRPDPEKALRAGDLEGFVAAGGTLIDLKPFAVLSQSI